MAVVKRSVSTLNSTEGNLVVLWSGVEKDVPPDPGPREQFTQDQEEYWYDLEFGVWNMHGRPDWPSAGDGATGKRVVFLAPGDQTYLSEFRYQLKKLALRAGIELEIISGRWDGALLDQMVDQAIGLHPDMVMTDPENLGRGGQAIARIHEAGIPVMACNFLPPSEACEHLLFWTGPDDWGQARALAREFARLMDYQGKYAIVRHVEGSSSYYARTWGVITELNKIAPLMECVEMAAPGLDYDSVHATVAGWLATHGRNLKGLIAADDRAPMVAVRDALESVGRAGEVICGAFGSSLNGLKLIKAGTLHALAFQAPSIDATVAMQTVIDWFDGLRVETVRYLPIYIVTSQTVDDLLRSDESVVNVNFDRLKQAIEEFDYKGVYDFFTGCYLDFLGMKLVSLSSFYGFGLQTIGFFLVLIRDYSLPAEELFGDYETMYKQVLTQKNIGSVMQWFIQLSTKIMDKLSQRLKFRTVIHEVLGYIHENFRTPVSLKTLSETFNISTIYLGQMFRTTTGMKFNDYLAMLRIKEAKRLLMSSSVSASAVAKLVGYADPNYFYKVFHKLEGKSVSDFQK